MISKNKKLFRLLPQNTIFFECDIQSKFTSKHIKNGKSVVHNARRLAITAKIFKIPIISTMQVPKIFGTTAEEIAEIYEKEYPEGVFRHEKVMFTMLEAPVMNKLESLAPRNKIVLYGCESHVCVKQTCFDLLEKDYDVTLVVDAISSMGYHDRTVGIEAMRDAGAQITTF